LRLSRSSTGGDLVCSFGLLFLPSLFLPLPFLDLVLLVGVDLTTFTSEVLLAGGVGDRALYTLEELDFGVVVETKCEWL
jgi:hypothetical protein